MSDSPLLFLPVAFAGAQQPKVSTPPEKGPGIDTGTQAPAVPGAPGTAGTQAPAQGPLGPCSDPSMLLMFAVFGGFFWLMVLRPEQRKRKEAQKMLAALQQGDRVVTSGGIHGIVASLAETTVTLRIDNFKMTVDRVAIVRLVRDEPAAEKDGGKDKKPAGK